jgi:hypothetical protein
MIAWTAILRIQAAQRAQGDANANANADANANDNGNDNANGEPVGESPARRHSEELCETKHSAGMLSEPFELPIRARWSLEELYDDVGVDVDDGSSRGADSADS